MQPTELTAEKLAAIRADAGRLVEFRMFGRRTVHALLSHADALQAKVAHAKGAYSTMNEEVCQTLGAALGYPRFCDDRENFPQATEEDGVCVGDHVAETLAMEAARRIAELASKVARLEGERDATPIRFSSRGIGFDWGVCFMCEDDEEKLHANIAAFVASKESGDAAVRLLDGRARNDYRPSCPNRVQVKICACTKHEPNLKELDRLLCANDVISGAIIAQAKGAAHVAHD